MQVIKPGDVVVLKSGGPAMTVQARSPEHSKYIATWFSDERQEFIEHTFRAEQLRILPVPPRA